MSASVQRHRIRRGLDLPLAGRAPPEPAGDSAVRNVALVFDDYIGCKPRVLVDEGDDVVQGQVVAEDRVLPGVRFTAPVGGRIAAVTRGERRQLQGVTIEAVDDAGREAAPPATAIDRERVRGAMLEAGLWPALRARPYSTTADPERRPHSIFVTAIETQPLAPPVEPTLDGREDDFVCGLRGVATLTDGPTFLCRGAESSIDVADARVTVVEFSGPHPAGTVGVHIHHLDPVHRGKTVWHIGYQDVVALGALLRTGAVDTRRTVTIAGPGVVEPTAVRVPLGSAVGELVDGRLIDDEVRMISGSVLSGRAATGPQAYLGRYHQQVTVLREGRERELLGWLAPGFDRFSMTPLFVSWWTAQLRRLLGRQNPPVPFDTSTHGERRAMVPIGAYERVLPMDLLPTHLLRALVVGDLEWSEDLGALELDEEDLALCSFVCPGKVDYGAHLRAVLDDLREGR